MKFAFLGPESTAKTTIVTELSNRLPAVYVPEVARDCLKDIGLNYTYDDILNIAKKQFQTELIMTDQFPYDIILCDTELITIQIWLEYLHYDVPSWLEDYIRMSNYTCYLLFNTDIPWVEDSLRANRNDRDEILQLFIRKLNFYQKNWILINGNGEDRIMNVQKVIESYTDDSL